jgi:Protein of unknown function (DUF2911)
MRKRRAILLMLFLSLAIAPAASWSQENGGPLLSPPAKASCKFSNGKTISVNYSSPRVRKRKIYGELVPYGEVWRAGANEATTFVTNTDLIVGGKLVPAGKYTLFAVPNPDRWTLVISKKTGEWGIPYPGAGYDLLQTDMKVGKLAERVENFAIAFDQVGGTCTMRLDWETTRASIEISEKK